MESVKFSQFVYTFLGIRHMHKNQRVGQAFYNALVLCQPDLADLIRETDLDPFYIDERCVTLIKIFRNDAVFRKYFL